MVFVRSLLTFPYRSLLPTFSFSLRGLCMQICVNDESVDCPDQCSLTALLQQLELVPQGLAIAVNQSIVAKSQWDAYRLSVDDQVTLIRATAGG